MVCTVKESKSSKGSYGREFIIHSRTHNSSGKPAYKLIPANKKPINSSDSYIIDEEFIIPVEKITKRKFILAKDF